MDQWLNAELGPGVLAAPRQLPFEGSLGLHTHRAAAMLLGIGSAPPGWKTGTKKRLSSPDSAPSPESPPHVSPET